MGLLYLLKHIDESVKKIAKTAEKLAK